MVLDEILESPAFWILGGFGIVAELLGFIISKKMGIEAFPLWQLVIIMIFTLGVAAFFALRD